MPERWRTVPGSRIQRRAGGKPAAGTWEERGPRRRPIPDLQDWICQAVALAKLVPANREPHFGWMAPANREPRFGWMAPANREAHFGWMAPADVVRAQGVAALESAAKLAAESATESAADVAREVALQKPEAKLDRRPVAKLENQPAAAVPDRRTAGVRRQALQSGEAASVRGWREPARPFAPKLRHGAARPANRCPDRRRSCGNACHTPVSEKTPGRFPTAPTPAANRAPAPATTDARKTPRERGIRSRAPASPKPARLAHR